MRIFICDDEKKMVDDINQIVKEVLPDAVICSFESGGAFLAHPDKSFDIALLDIDMPGMTGLEVAASMAESEKKTLIVFVTAHDELVYDSLKYHPFAFVRKAYIETELRETLLDCLKELDRKERTFTFRTGGRSASIPVKNIVYFEAEANYLAVHEQTGVYKFRSTLASVEKALAQDDFVRIHKGFLVNAKYVRTIKSEEITLDGGKALPIGKTYLNEARSQILRYMRK